MLPNASPPPPHTQQVTSVVKNESPEDNPLGPKITTTDPQTRYTDGVKDQISPVLPCLRAEKHPGVKAETEEEPAGHLEGCDLSAEAIENNMRTFLTAETVYTLTRKLVRERLENNFNLARDALLPRRSEINAILARVVCDCCPSVGDTTPSDSGSLSSSQDARTSKVIPATINASSGQGTGKTSHSTETSGVPSRESLDDKTWSKDGRSPASSQLLSSVSPRQPVNQSSRNSSDAESNHSSDADSSDTSSYRRDGGRRKRQRPNESHSSSATKSQSSASQATQKGARKAQARLMTKAAFKNNAEALELRLGDLDFKLEPRVFSTGSCGWYFGKKISLKIGREKPQEALCLLNVNCTVVGSKTWAEGGRRTTKRDDEDDD